MRKIAVVKSLVAKCSFVKFANFVYLCSMDKPTISPTISTQTWCKNPKYTANLMKVDDGIL